MDLTRRLLLESDEYAERMYWDINYDSDFDGLMGLVYVEKQIVARKDGVWINVVSKPGNTYSSSDISSGYHSTGVNSDVCSYSSEESRDSLHQPITDTSKQEAMRFESVEPLCDNLNLILSMPDLCDVTFLVGPEEVAIHGVRAILGARSRIFYDLILKHLTATNNRETNKKKCSTKKTVGISHPFADRLVIPVKKYDAVVFRNLVQFIHCGTVNITEETVAGLYCGACQFELPDLSRACLKFIERRVQADDYETVLRSTRNYSHHMASKSLFDKIYAVIDMRFKNNLETSV